MKRVLMVLIAMIAMSWLPLTLAESSAAPKTGEVPTWVSSALTGGAMDSQEKPVFEVSESYISCWDYDGYSCPVNGTRVRCMWIPTEPGFCRCVSNVWTCG
jgi:hypothetical protein